jgi:hypothetical protein
MLGSRSDADDAAVQAGAAQEVHGAAAVPRPSTCRSSTNDHQYNQSAIQIQRASYVSSTRRGSYRKRAHDEQVRRHESRANIEVNGTRATREYFDGRRSACRSACIPETQARHSSRAGHAATTGRSGFRRVCLSHSCWSSPQCSCR